MLLLTRLSPVMPSRVTRGSGMSQHSLTGRGQDLRAPDVSAVELQDRRHGVFDGGRGNNLDVHELAVDQRSLIVGLDISVIRHLLHDDPPTAIKALVVSNYPRTGSPFHELLREGPEIRVIEMRLVGVENDLKSLHVSSSH